MMPISKCDLIDCKCSLIDRKSSLVTALAYSWQRGDDANKQKWSIRPPSGTNRGRCRIGPRAVQPERGLLGHAPLFVPARLLASSPQPMTAKSFTVLLYFILSWRAILLDGSNRVRVGECPPFHSFFDKKQYLCVTLAMEQMSFRLYSCMNVILI